MCSNTCLTRNYSLETGDSIAVKQKLEGQMVLKGCSHTVLYMPFLLCAVEGFTVCIYL